MGFGYVFLGLVISLNFFVYDTLTMPIAILLLLRGMMTLSRFNRPLQYAFYTLWPALPTALLSFFLELLRMLGILTEAHFQSARQICAPLLLLFLLIFLCCLLRGVALLAEETELPKLAYRAKRNTALTLIVYTGYLFFSLPIATDWFAFAAAHALFPFILGRLFVTVLNAILLYSCYMWICMPQDLDMARKKTGITFLDTLNERLDKKEADAQEKEKEELARIYHEREAKYHEKQKKKKEGSKK